MSRRARPAQVPGERVRRLLSPPAGGGWLPPPEPGDGDGSRFGDEVDGPAAAAGPAAEPVAAPARESGSAEDPDPGETGFVVPERPAGHRARRARRWPDSRAAAPAGGPQGGARLAGLLPVALRTGRLDPGRRGAAALVLVAVLAAVVAGGVLLRGRPQEVLLPEVVSSGRPLPGVSASPDVSGVVVVAVAGEVARPGLVRLPAGSRVDDALRAAGGLAAGGSTGLLNLARRLVDGEQVLVGIDPPAGAPAVAGGSAPGGLLDLNTATVVELDALPGIGPVLAQRIVDWRTENQRFGSIDQLREVTGIGEAKYADLEKEVTV